ncbi:MAG: hypothetical protein QOF51_1739 [Chloroflexota bacterium]|nr:hypothetical protein [Chloroflexota bacterium]
MGGARLLDDGLHLRVWHLVGGYPRVVQALACVVVGLPSLDKLTIIGELPGLVVVLHRLLGAELRPLRWRRNGHLDVFDEKLHGIEGAIREGGSRASNGAVPEEYDGEHGGDSPTRHEGPVAPGEVRLWKERAPLGHRCGQCTMQPRLAQARRCSHAPQRAQVFGKRKQPGGFTLGFGISRSVAWPAHGFAKKLFECVLGFARHSRYLPSSLEACAGREAPAPGFAARRRRSC